MTYALDWKIEGGPRVETCRIMAQASPALSAISMASEDGISTLHLVKKNRCELEGCSKKLDLTAMPCKCTRKFCARHRCSSDHACTYDYRKAGTEHLSTCLVKVAGSKIEKV